MSTPNANDLKQIPLFASLSGSDRKLLADNLEIHDYPAGAVLLAAGQDNDSFFVLSEGEVDVSVKGDLRCTLRPGAFFGEISLTGAAACGAWSRPTHGDCALAIHLAGCGNTPTPVRLGPSGRVV